MSLKMRVLVGWAMLVAYSILYFAHRLIVAQLIVFPMLLLVRHVGKPKFPRLPKSFEICATVFVLAVLLAALAAAYYTFPPWLVGWDLSRSPRTLLIMITGYSGLRHSKGGPTKVTGAILHAARTGSSS